MELNSIKKYLEDCLKENGFTDLYLVEMKINASRKISIFLDSDEGVSYMHCRKISRYIEEILDESLEYGDDYKLEVSSAGVGSPLKMLRQYTKNIGRTVIIKMTDDEKLRGILTDATSKILTIRKEVVQKQGKKKSKTFEEKEMQIEMKNILETKIAVSF